MALSEEASKELAKVRAEWNEAEAAIKLAEQVSGKIIDPAIYELRYCGRRIVEAISLADEGNHIECLKRLQDAHFDCCRARHDAIDAATSKIAADLEIAVAKLGPEILLEKFHKTSELYSELSKIRGAIVKSRKNREDRHAIYAVIQAGNLNTIIAIYSEFQACEPLMVAAARRQRHERYLNRGLAVGGVLVGALALLF